LAWGQDRIRLLLIQRIEATNTGDTKTGGLLPIMKQVLKNNDQALASILAEIREQNPEMLRGYCDLQVTLTPPLRPVPRVVASA